MQKMHANYHDAWPAKLDNETDPAALPRSCAIERGHRIATDTLRQGEETFIWLAMTLVLHGWKSLQSTMPQRELQALANYSSCKHEKTFATPHTHLHVTLELFNALRFGRERNGARGVARRKGHMQDIVGSGQVGQPDVRSRAIEALALVWSTSIPIMPVTDEDAIAGCPLA